MAPSSGRATKPSMPPSTSRRSSSSQPRPPVAPSTPIPPRDDPFCSSGMGLLMPPSCSDDAPGDSRGVGDDQDDPSWEPHGEGGGIGSFSFSDSSSSDGDGDVDDDASAASTATRDDDVEDGTDDDALTFQTLDDESDYQTKLVFRKYHGPVADLGAPGAAAATTTTTTTPGYRKPEAKPHTSSVRDDPVALKAEGGSGIRFYPFWLRQSAAPDTTPRTTNSGSTSNSAETAAAPSPDSAAPPAVEGSKEPTPATPKQDNDDDDDDNDSGVACFPRFEAPTCGGNCHNLPAADDDESSGGRGGDNDPKVVEPPPPTDVGDVGENCSSGRATATAAAPSSASIEAPVALPEDELTAAADLSTIPSTTYSGSNNNNNNNVDVETAGPERGGASLNLHDRLAIAADAIDQTVEAVLGLCVPEKPICVRENVLCVPENPTMCYGGDWAETTSVPENPTVCFGNWTEADLQQLESDSPRQRSLVEDDEAEPRLRWRPDDDLAPAAEGWATFPPKVEVTPQDDDDFSCHNGVGDNHSSIHRNTKMIVSSTTEERDDTRVVTIVGMDEVLNRHRRKRRGTGRGVQGPRLLGRWLRGPAAKSLQEPHHEGGSQIASMRQRSLFSSRSLDGSASRPHARRRTAKHRREPWFRRLVTPRGARSLVPKEEIGSGTGNAGDNEDEDDARSFRSRSTLSSKFGGEESVVLDWPVPRASSFVVANDNETKNQVENDYDYGCHDQACRIALQDIDVYSYCSVTSSLGSHESGAPFLSSSWFWALLPIRELRILSRAVGIDTYSDEEEDGTNKGGDEVDGNLATGPRSKGGMHVTVGGDGASPEVQKFAPIHVRKGETHWEEAPPSPPLSTITMLTLPHRQNSLMVEESGNDIESPSQPSRPSVPARLNGPADDGGGERVWNPTGSFVTEDERTVTDGDSSIHTIRLLRVPAQPATPSQAPLPLPPPRTTTRPSRSKRAVYAMTYPKPKAIEVPTTPLSWQPGLSARKPHGDGPPGSAESPRSVLSFKTKALADDLSQHEESQSPSLSTASLRPSVAHGDGGGSPDDHGTPQPTRSPPKRTRRRPYSFRSESARPSSPLTGAAPSSPHPASPRSPKRSSGDRTPLLPKDVSSSVASASSRSPTYATHDETTTFASASFDDDASQQHRQQGFVTTTLKIRRVPTYEGGRSPSNSS